MDLFKEMRDMHRQMQREFEDMERNFFSEEREGMRALMDREREIDSLVEARDSYRSEFDERMAKMREEMRDMERALTDKRTEMQRLMDEHQIEEDEADGHKFSTTVRHQAYQITDDGRKVEYKGDSHSSVMGERQLKEAQDSFSMEIGDHHNMITVGVATRRHNLGTQVGADADSWGFNLSTGHLVHNGDTGVEYGRRVQEGEKITIHLDREAGTLRMEINGEDQGIAFTDDKLKTLKLWPVMSTGVISSAKFIDGKEVQKSIKNE
jgi:hypothetical protein